MEFDHLPINPNFIRLMNNQKVNKKILSCGAKDGSYKYNCIQLPVDDLCECKHDFALFVSFIKTYFPMTSFRFQRINPDSLLYTIDDVYEKNVNVIGEGRLLIIPNDYTGFQGFKAFLIMLILKEINVDMNKVPFDKLFDKLFLDFMIIDPEGYDFKYATNCTFKLSCSIDNGYRTLAIYRGRSSIDIHDPDFILYNDKDILYIKNTENPPTKKPVSKINKFLKAYLISQILNKK